MLWLNVAVVVLKLVAFFSSHVLSVFAESVQSSLDATNNVFALWIARLAGSDPDEEHPYGHAKFETLGALALVGVLSITVFELMQRSIARVLGGAPPRVEATPVAIGVMAFSMAAGVAVSVWEARRGRALGSHILTADAAHTRSDVLTSAAVLASLVAIRFGHPNADPWITMGVAVIIAHTGWSILRETVPVLVDERAVDPSLIQSVAEQVPQVTAAYGIRSRGRTGDVFAELTIAVAGDLDVTRGHEIADEVERRVAEEVGAREVLVHVEPA